MRRKIFWEPNENPFYKQKNASEKIAFVTIWVSWLWKNYNDSDNLNRICEWVLLGETFVKFTLTWSREWDLFISIELQSKMLLPSSRALITFSGTKSKYWRQRSTNPSPRSGNKSRTCEMSESISTDEISRDDGVGFFDGSASTSRVKNCKHIRARDYFNACNV